MDTALTLLLGAVFGVLVTTIAALVRSVPAEIDRHDLQIADRDHDLEEWMIYRHRRLTQRFQEILGQANESGVLKGTSVEAGIIATRTLLLYDYREELRQAGSFVRGVAVDERWAHRLVRKLRGKPFPDLTVPNRAARLVDYWQEDKARNALTWTLGDILDELPARATSRAQQGG